MAIQAVEKQLDFKKMKAAIVKEVTASEAIALVASKGSTFGDEIIKELKAFHDVAGKITVYTGDTELPDLNVGNDIAIVDGNLTVAGLIQDCVKVDASLLIVLGDVACRNFITLSSIFITGNLNINNIVLGDSLGDYALKVGGDLTARTVMEGGHWFEITGEATVEHLFHSHGSVRDKNGVLKPNLADSDLMEDFTENPESYPGFSYVEMMDDLQDEGAYDLPKTIKFIRQGGEIVYKT